MKNVWAILVWGVLIFAIGTYLDKVRGMLMGGGDPVMGYALRFGVGLMLAVFVVLVGRWLRRWGGGMSPGRWFVAGAVAWLIQGGYVWWGNPRRTVDVQVHDTLIVIWYLHAASGIAVVFGVIGTIYYLNRGLNRAMGYVHFWLSFSAFYLVLWMETIKYGGLPVSGTWELRNWQTNQVVGWAYAIMAMLFVAAQVLFAGNLVGSLFSRNRRRRAANGRFR